MSKVLIIGAGDISDISMLLKSMGDVEIVVIGDEKQRGIELNKPIPIEPIHLPEITEPSIYIQQTPLESIQQRHRKYKKRK